MNPPRESLFPHPCVRAHVLNEYSTVADIVSATKNRFAPGRVNLFIAPQLYEDTMETIKSRKIQFSRFSQCCGESFYCISNIRGIMKKIMPSKITSLLLTLTLMVAALWVGPALAAEMVKDPTTGKMVVAPEYGGTITWATARCRRSANHVDMWFHHHPGET